LANESFDPEEGIPDAFTLQYTIPDIVIPIFIMQGVIWLVG